MRSTLTLSLTTELDCQKQSSFETSLAARLADRSCCLALAKAVLRLWAKTSCSSTPTTKALVSALMRRSIARCSRQQLDQARLPIASLARTQAPTCVPQVSHQANSAQ